MRSASSFLTALTAVALVTAGSWLLPAAARAQEAAGDRALHRVVLGGQMLTLSPPALVREGHLLLPLSFLERRLGVSVSLSVADEGGVLRFYDRYAHFTFGERGYRSREEGGLLPLAPCRGPEDYYLPAELLQSALGLRLRESHHEGLAVVQVEADGGRVQAVRLGEHNDHVRLVLDLDAPSIFEWELQGDRLVLRLPPPAGEPVPGGVHLQGFDSPALVRVARSVTEIGGELVEVDLRGAVMPQLLTLADPPRLVVDVPLPATPAPPEPQVTEPLPPPPSAPSGRPAPGWALRNFTTPRGPLRTYVLQISPRDPDWRLRPALAGPTVHQRRTLPAIARQEQAVAALNGGFFALQGPPAGLIMLNGEWVISPLYRRSSLGISESGEARIGAWAFKGRAYFAGHGSLELTGLNRAHHQGDELIAYTRHWGAELPGNGLYVRLVISPAEVVVRKETGGRAVPIPAEGYVLSGRGRFAELLRKVDDGQRASVTLDLDPPWPQVRWLLEGGPRLVRDGRVAVEGAQERFRSDVTDSDRPRSAVGITAGGEVLLVAAEGPNNRGVTLRELAGIMIKLGAVQAMNLDGGGSTTVCQGDRVVNAVGSNCRPVSSALVVVPRAPVAPVAEPVPADPAQLPGDLAPPPVRPGPPLAAPD